MLDGRIFPRDIPEGDWSNVGQNRSPKKYIPHDMRLGFWLRALRFTINDFGLKTTIRLIIKLNNITKCWLCDVPLE